MANSRHNDTEQDAPTTDKTIATLHSLLDRIAEQTAEAETRIRAAAGDAEKTVRERSRQARSKSLELSSEAEHQARALADSVEGYVRERPAQALGIAFLGGLLISGLLRRRS